MTLAIDWIAGSFFEQLSGLGKLDGLDPEPAMQSLSIGDTSITFANGGKTHAELAWNSIIEYLMMHGREELICYRRIKW